MSINDVKSLLQPVIHDSPKLKSDSESSLFDLGSPIKKQMSELVPPASPTLNSEQLTESPPTKMAKRKNFDFGGLGDSEDNMIQAKRRRFQWYVFNIHVLNHLLRKVLMPVYHYHIASSLLQAIKNVAKHAHLGY